MRSKIKTIVESATGVWTVNFEEGPSLTLPEKHDIFRLAGLNDEVEIEYHVCGGPMVILHAVYHNIWAALMEDKVKEPLIVGPRYPVPEVQVKSDDCYVVFPSGKAALVQGRFALMYYLGTFREFILTTAGKRVFATKDEVLSYFDANFLTARDPGRVRLNMEGSKPIFNAEAFKFTVVFSAKNEVDSLHQGLSMLGFDIDDVELKVHDDGEIEWNASKFLEPAMAATSAAKIIEDVTNHLQTLERVTCALPNHGSNVHVNSLKRLSDITFSLTAKPL